MMLSLRRLVVLGLLGTLFAQGAQAFAPAGTQLTNQATLSFNGGSAINASVTVAVQLVTAPPVLVQEPSATATVAQNGTYNVTYTVRADANGSDEYNVTFPTETLGGGGFSTAPSAATSQLTPSGSTTGFNLGATAFATDPGIGDTILTVPSDGVGGGANAPVNGIDDGEQVWINGVVYTVASTNANASGTSTITLSTALTNDPGGIGAGIYEIETFEVEITSTGVPTGATATITLETDVQVAGTPAESDSFTVTITVAAVTFEKYVRNETAEGGFGVGRNDQNNDGSDITYDYDNDATAEDFYDDAGDVVAIPGDTLVYYLRVVAPSGGGDLNNTLITDVLPTFTTYTDNSTFTAENATLPMTAVSDNATGSSNFPFEAADAYDYGTVSDGDTLHVIYKITVQ